MHSNEIRETFISFFAEREHEIRPSASLIPVDPTLLVTNAGMVPFKPYFLGEEEPPWPRAVSVQKCVRTVDIDIIGSTQRHLSFFEMLGNFSFGDYFKEKAIPWGYELVTEVLALDPELLWFTVHETDDEAAEIWVDGVGVPPGRVQRGGKDNFWQMGVPGPCGPSSEIFYDKGEDFGEGGGPIGGGEDRYVELWNLVFMQNLQDEPYHVVGDLPAKNIDTGMGLDRVAAVLQGVPSVFEIDTTRQLLAAAERHTRLQYGAGEHTDVSLRILADHGRCVTFLIADGVVPSNDGRGYVLRRILRRAVRHAWQYRGEGLVFPALVESTIDAMGEGYPEPAQRDFILDVVTREEERFRQTLESGHQLLDSELAREPDELSGRTAFKLHDTYGFPIDLTREIAAERGMDIDLDGFEAEMEAQRERARAAWKGSEDIAGAEVYRSILDAHGLTDFVGYDFEASDGILLSMVADGEVIERAEAGRDVELIRGGYLVLRVDVLPPPHVPVDLHLEDVAFGFLMDVEDRIDRRHGYEQQQDRGGGRPADLELGVAVDLLRDVGVARACPEAHDGDDDQPLHEDEDRDGDGEHETPEIILRLRRRPVRAQGVQRVVGRVGRAARGEQRDEPDDEAGPRPGQPPAVPVDRARRRWLLRGRSPGPVAGAHVSSISRASICGCRLASRTRTAAALAAHRRAV